MWRDVACAVREPFEEAPECGEAVGEVMGSLDSMGLVDDAAYAKWHARQRTVFRPRSKYVLGGELMQKGIAKGIVDHTLPEYDEEAACRTIAERVVPQGLRRGRTRRDLIASLQRRGFPFLLCIKCIDEVQQELTGDADRDERAP
jgi:SOS response regulatory protein OraA/RecX